MWQSESRVLKVVRGGGFNPRAVLWGQCECSAQGGVTKDGTIVLCKERDRDRDEEGEG